MKWSQQFSSRGLFRRRTLLISVVLVALAAISLWTYKPSQRAWEEYKAELAARGEPVDWKDCVSLKMPAELENFGATPLLRRIGRRGQNDPEFWSRVSSTGLRGQMGETGDWTHGQAANLEALQFYLRTNRNRTLPLSPPEPAEDVLAALDPLEVDLQELREAAQRPFAKLELSYPDPISADVPNFVSIRTLAQACSLHASAELALGNSDRAFADILVIHRLADTAAQEPTLVSAMICTALHDLALQTFWEGWISNRWSDQQLVAFQRRLGPVDLLGTVYRAMSIGERAGINYVMEHYSNDKLASALVTGTPSELWDICRQHLTEIGIRYSPVSWRYKNQLFYNRLLDESFFSGINVRAQRVFPKRCQASALELDKVFARPTPFNFLAAVATPNSKRAFITMARTQTAINEAALVCALERYFRTHGQYPPLLETLVPDFVSKLRHDVVTGEPLKYRRTEGGKFLLYSVGWNEKDDAGDPDRENGDWIWPTDLK